MRESSSSSSELMRKREAFVRAIEGLGDVLVFETARKTKKEVVERYLEELVDLLLSMISSIEGDSIDARINYSDEFIDAIKIDSESISLLYSLYPERFSIAVSTGLAQLRRVHEAAASVRNGDVSRSATYKLTRLLREFVGQPNRAHLIDQVLDTFSAVRAISVREDDISVYPSAVHWFTAVVFAREEDGSVLLEYLPKLTRHYFDGLIQLVRLGKSEPLNHLAEYLPDSLHWHETIASDVFAISQLASNQIEDDAPWEGRQEVSKLGEELRRRAPFLTTAENLVEWKSTLSNLCDLLVLVLDVDAKKTMNSLRDKLIRQAERQCKFWRLRSVILGVLAYCLFKRQIEYVRKVITARQPDDADAHWVGTDVIPTDPIALSKLYIGIRANGLQLDFREGHHGTERYYSQLFLYLLHYGFRSNQPVPPISILAVCDAGNLNELIFEMDRVERHLANFDDEDDARIQKIMGGVDVARVREIRNVVVNFLAALRLEAKKQINLDLRRKELSEEKVSRFISEIVESYEEHVFFRKLFASRGCLQVREERFTGGQLGIFRLDDKEAFIDNWHVDYGAWGESYGESMAEGEDVRILRSLIEVADRASTTVKEALMKALLSQDALTIVAVNERLFDLEDENSDFVAKWRLPEDNSKYPRFSGVYRYGEHEVDVYSIFDKALEAGLLLLAPQTIGCILQRTSTEDGVGSSKHLFVSVNAIDSESENLKKLLDNPPEWLQAEHSSPEAQCAYLETKVEIRLFEELEHSPGAKRPVFVTGSVAKEKGKR